MTAALLWLLACGGSVSLDGTPLPAGRYTPLGGGNGFTVDADGVLDNGDALHCRTGLAGDRLALDCHGHALTGIVWRAGADSVVHTDLLDRVYGEGDPAPVAYRFVPR